MEAEQEFTLDQIVAGLMYDTDTQQKEAAWRYELNEYIRNAVNAALQPAGTVVAEERAEFEAKFPIPRDCYRGQEGTDIEGRYDSRFNSWDCDNYNRIWEGWQARAVLASQPAKPAEVPPAILNRTEEIRLAMANPVALKRDQLVNFVECLLGHIAFTNASVKPAEVGGVVELLREALGVVEGVPSDYGVALAERIRAAIAAQTAAPKAVDGANAKLMALLGMKENDDTHDILSLAAIRIERLQAAHQPAAEAEQAVDLSKLEVAYILKQNGKERWAVWLDDVQALLAAGGKGGT
ncbi:MAG: hypothetical protein JO253_03230 [Alphaproteobacteria bacterium]|nr:hypothetical protein [Alphaproteobacteria bacterium]